MKISKKRTVQVMVFAIALLLVLALSIGITGAWYQAKRQASGTVIMNQGIIIDYKGFDQGDSGIWTKDKATTFLLFSETNAQPGQNIAVNASSIRANVDSVDFYARVKLDYKFYNVVKSAEEGVEDTKTEVALANPSDLITTSANFFGANWVKSQNNDGWFYYGADTALGKLTPSEQESAFVSLFADNAKFVIEGENFEGAENGGEGGGFVVGDKSINKIEVTLTLETLQGSADAKNEGWTITPIIRGDVSGLTSGSNTQIEDVLSSTITETTEDVYIAGAPTDPVTITIGSKAFAGCPKLVLNLSNDSNITYIIASDAFESTAKVNYGATNITSNIRSAEQSYNEDITQMNPISETIKVYAYKPSTFTPNGSTNTSYGKYQYTDTQGNTWYYDLIDESGKTVTLPASAFSASTLAGSQNVSAKIKYVNNNSSLTTLTIPQYIQSSDVGSERYKVTRLENYTNATSIIKNKTNVNTVIIPDSVTRIEYYVFYGCEFTSITIPDSVTSIGVSVFADCRSLTSVTIGNGVTSIGYSAFEGCWDLTSVIIGNSVTSIGERAFRGCKFTSITIPDSVTSIGRQAFYGCEFTSITIPDRVTSIHSEAFLSCTNLTTINIGAKVTEVSWLPTTVTNITISENNENLARDEKAIFTKKTGNVLELSKFMARNDTSYEIPSKLTLNSVELNVTSIAKSVFSGCRSLESITIPDSVTSIGSGAFSGCSSLTTVNIGAGVTNASWLPSTVTNLTISKSNPNLASDGKAIFAKKTDNVLELSKFIAKNDTSYDIPSKLTLNSVDWLVTSIVREAFYGCTSLTSITIPDSVTSIGEKAFCNCSSLTSVTVGNSVRTIGKYAFQSCSSLKSITIPNSVRFILYSAFKGCTGLTSITIPDSVTSIGDDAFNTCWGLRSIDLGKGVTSIGLNAFASCSSLTTITIPDSVTSIGSQAFGYCTGLTSINIGAGVTNVGWLPSSVTNVTISENNASLASDGKAIFKKSDNVLELIKYASSDESYSIPSKLTLNNVDWNVTSIAKSVFSGCTSLTSITIPDSVTSIGGSAFSGCKGLTSVTIGSGVTAIPQECFYNCSALVTVVIKGTKTSFESSAFQNCSALTSVLFNKNTSISISINGMTQAEGTFDENGNKMTGDTGAYIKLVKQTA